MDREKLREALVEYFGLESQYGSYIYELIRVKEDAVTIDDFVEFGEAQIEDLTEFLIRKLK